MSPLGRLRKQLDRGDRARALAVRRADAVAAGIAATDHDDVLAARENVGLLHREPLHPSVLLGQEVHCEVNAVELASGYRQVAGNARTDGQAHRIEGASELFARNVLADVDARTDRDAFCLHLLEAPIDQVLLHLEVGDAIGQKTSGSVVALEHRDVVPGACATSNSVVTSSRSVSRSACGSTMPNA